MSRRTKTGSNLLPSSITNLFFWVRADLGITLNGSNVSGWADQSGNGNSLSQGTAASQPAYHSNGGANNQAYIQWTPQGQQSLDNGSVTLAQSFEMFIVMHQNAALGAAGSTYILDIGNAGSQGAINQASLSTTIQFAAGDAQTTTTVGDHLVDAQLNGASSGISIDGAAFVTASHAQTISQLHAGQAGGLTTFGMNGSLYEIAIYSRILNAGEVALFKQYVRARYGISVQ